MKKHVCVCVSVCACMHVCMGMSSWEGRELVCVKVCLCSVFVVSVFVCVMWQHRYRKGGNAYTSHDIFLS